MTVETARLCTEDRDYRRYGIEKGNPQPFEDDMHTPGGKGTFEWWCRISDSVLIKEQHEVS